MPRPLDSQKALSVSLRIPPALHAEASTRARVRRVTLTQLLLEGLRLALDVPLDPREVPVSQLDATAELEALIDTRVRAILVAEGVLQQDGQTATQDSNAVMQKEAKDGNAVTQEQQKETPQRKRGRQRSAVGQQILDLLADHPEGLSAEQIRGYLTPGKPIGDLLQGMRKTGVLRAEGNRKEMRYFIVDQA